METRINRYLRSDLVGFTGYSSARSSDQDGTIWLNANEAPDPNPVAPNARRYPDPQPRWLATRLAHFYDVAPEQVLVGRGSDEGIDLLIRATCHARQDAIIVCPPTFGMYEVSATIHGAKTLKVPQSSYLSQVNIQWREIEEAARQHPVKLVFICRPGNPVGDSEPLRNLADAAEALEGQALLVVDEAYQEFSNERSAITLLDKHENIVVLRTLSKAFGLAGLRVGSVIAAPALIRALRACQAPYPLPEPVIRAAMDALDPRSRPSVAGVIANVVAERNRMTLALDNLPGVELVYLSEANFLLVRFHDPDKALAALSKAGIVVRDQRYHDEPFMKNAIRITIGTPEENDQVLACLETL